MTEPKTFFYFHGFNSDGDGWKAQALRKHFPDVQVLAPDLPASPEEIIEIATAYFSNIPSSQLVLFGSSYGGFFAYYFSAILHVPAILINPSLEPYHTLDGRGIGHFETWTKQRAYHFKTAYLQNLSTLRKQADAQIDPTKLHFWLAEDDDVLDLNMIPQWFAKSDIRWFANAGHGFSKFEKAVKVFKESQGAL